MLFQGSSFLCLRRREYQLGAVIVAAVLCADPQSAYAMQTMYCGWADMVLKIELDENSQTVTVNSGTNVPRPGVYSYNKSDNASDAAISSWDPIGATIPSIAEIRRQYPQYNDLSDQQLADALHKKFYSGMPRPEFDAKIGLQTADERKPKIKWDDEAPAPKPATDGSEALKELARAELARREALYKQIETLSQALKNAHAAGDVVAAKKLADALRAAISTPAAPQPEELTLEQKRAIAKANARLRLQQQVDSVPEFNNTTEYQFIISDENYDYIF
jgi:hypothetical protein